MASSPNTGKNATWIRSIGFAVSSRTKNLKKRLTLLLSSLWTGRRQLNYELGMAVPNPDRYGRKPDS